MPETIGLYPLRSRGELLPPSRPNTEVCSNEQWNCSLPRLGQTVDRARSLAGKGHPSFTPPASRAGEKEGYSDLHSHGSHGHGSQTSTFFCLLVFQLSSLELTRPPGSLAFSSAQSPRYWPESKVILEVTLSDVSKRPRRLGYCRILFTAFVQIHVMLQEEEHGL